MNNYFNFSNPYNRNIPLDPYQFQKNLGNLTPQMLDNAVIQARRQGIPEYEIEQGINYLKSLTSRRG